MDKLVETKHERYWNREALARDLWVKQHASTLPPGSRVLDAGAGASKYRPFFSHCRYETQDFCRYEGPLVKYVQPIDHVCDITAIPLPDASLDAILCTEVLEHVVDPIAVLREFSRLLKPGGKLLLTAPFASMVHMAPYHYYTGYTPFWYEYWLPKTGLRIVDMSSQGGPGRRLLSALDAFYTSWKDSEKNFAGLAGALSPVVRTLVRFPLYRVLHRMISTMAPHLEWRQGPVGLLVAAMKNSHRIDG